MLTDDSAKLERLERVVNDLLRKVEVIRDLIGQSSQILNVIQSSTGSQ